LKKIDDDKVVKGKIKNSHNSSSISKEKEKEKEIDFSLLFNNYNNNNFSNEHPYKGVLYFTASFISNIITSYFKEVFSFFLILFVFFFLL
jgi:Ca2+-dependent lipid-binding protein